MISPETGIHMIKALCSKLNVLKGVPRQNIELILDNFDFDIVLNANPESRKKVEEGEYCLRVNERGRQYNLLYNPRRFSSKKYL